MTAGRDTIRERTTPVGSRRLPRPLSPAHRKVRPGLPPTLQNHDATRLSPNQAARNRAPIAPVQRNQEYESASVEENRQSHISVQGLLIEAAPPVVSVREATSLISTQAPVVPIRSSATSENMLALRGDYWELRYQGSFALVEDSRGLRYIAILIQHAASAEGPLHATELVAFATGPRNGPIELGVKHPMLDSVAEQQLIKRLEEIAFQRNTAESRGDYESVEHIEEEADRITDELAKMHTPALSRGRRGTFSDAGEKARKAVSKAIKETISRISSLPQMQDLAGHFSKTIRKGQWLSYTGSLSWEVDFHPTQSEKKIPLRRAK